MLLLAALSALLVGAPAALAEVSMTTYPLPPAEAPLTAANTGSGITSDASGNVYFTTGDANGVNMPRIGRFDPKQGAAGTSAGITLWPTPLGATCCATQVRSLDFDDDAGRLWFVRSDGTYGFGEASVLASGGPSPFHTAVHPQQIGLYGVAYDPKTKRTWIAENGESNVQTPPGSGFFPGQRMASTDSGLALSEGKNLAQQLDEPVLNPMRYPADPIGAAPDGNGEVWFAESNPGNPGWRIGHTKGSGYEEYQLPCNGGSPCSGSNTGTGVYDVTVAKDGKVWFANRLNNSVGRLDWANNTFTMFPMATFDASLASATPLQIRAAPDGSIWVAENRSPYVQQTANAVVRLIPGDPVAAPDTVTATVFKTGNDAPLAIEPTAGGDVYFTLSTATAPGKLGRISGAVAVSPGGGGAPGGETPSGGGTPAPPGAVATPGATVVVKGTPSVAKILPPTSDSVSVRQICVGPPQDKCALVYLLDSHEYVTGFPGTKEQLGLAAAPKKKKPKTVELGRTEATLNGGETKDVKVSLSKKAKALLAKKMKLKVTLRVMEKQPDGTLKKVSSKEITFKAPKKKAKKK